MRLFILLQNLANGLTQPFMGFLAVVSGVSGGGLGVVSSATSFFTGVSQLAVSLRVRDVFKLFLWSMVVLSMLWTTMAFISYGNPLLYIVNYVLIAFFNGIIALSWSLILERVSRGSRGRILAEFGFYGSIGSLLATIVAGFVVGDRYWLAKWVFLTASILLMLNLANVVSIVREVDDAPATYSGAQGVRYVLANVSGMRGFLTATFLFAVVWAFAWPIFPLAQYYVLQMNLEQVAIVSVISGVSTLVLQKPIGVLVDKNRRIMLFLGRFLLLTFPLAYALATNVYEIYLANIVAGVTNSISNTAYIAYVFDNSQDKRTAIGLYNAIYGSGTLIGSVVGGFMVNALEPVLGVNESIRLLLFCDAAARALISVMYLKVPETGIASRGALATVSRHGH